MQAVSATVRIEGQDPPFVQQPHLGTCRIGLCSRVKCHASEIVLGTPPAPDLPCYGVFITLMTCITSRIRCGPPAAHEGPVGMPVGLC